MSEFSGWSSIELERETSLGSVQVANGKWNLPIDLSTTMSKHHLEMSILTVPLGANGCLVDMWGPDRFEKVGEMFFLPANQKVHFKSLVREQRSLICEFDAGRLGCWFEEELNLSADLSLNLLNMKSSRLRGHLLRMAEEVIYPGFASDSMVDLISSQIAIDLARILKRSFRERMSGGLSSWQLKVIDERLSELGSPPRLQELADLCKLSVRHLSRAFQVSKGESLGKYIAGKRITLAKKLIASGKSIKSVSYTLGFSAPSNFTAAFLRATGETPKEYRTIMRGIRRT